MADQVEVLLAEGVSIRLLEQAAEGLVAASQSSNLLRVEVARWKEYRAIPLSQEILDDLPPGPEGTCVLEEGLSVAESEECRTSATPGGTESADGIASTAAIGEGGGPRQDQPEPQDRDDTAAAGHARSTAPCLADGVQLQLL
jgi:hypothetical protein